MALGTLRAASVSPQRSGPTGAERDTHKLSWAADGGLLGLKAVMHHRLAWRCSRPGGPQEQDPGKAPPALEDHPKAQGHGLQIGNWSVWCLLVREAVTTAPVV